MIPRFFVRMVTYAVKMFFFNRVTCKYVLKFTLTLKTWLSEAPFHSHHLQKTKMPLTCLGVPWSPDCMVAGSRCWRVSAELVCQQTSNRLLPIN